MNIPTGTPTKRKHNNQIISYNSPTSNQNRTPIYKRWSPNRSSISFNPENNNSMVMNNNSFEISHIPFSLRSSPSSAQNIKPLNKQSPVQSLYSSSNSKQNTKIFGNEILNSSHIIISMNNGVFKLEPKFKEYLLERIPIFKDEYLYSLIIKYCLALNSNLNKNIEKSKNDIKEYLLKIKKECIKNMEKMKNIMVNKINEKYKVGSKLKPKTNNEYFNMFIKNEKYIKTHTITSEALIEALINCILYYCSKNRATINSSLYYSKSENNILYQIMNIAQEMSLSDYIKHLFKSKLDIVTKKIKLLKVLKDIARDLLHLQDTCGFIHGDLHKGNIFLKLHPTNENAPVQITFIDFGYSSIKLPLDNKENLILTTPNESITITKNKKLYKSELPYDIESKPYLKAIDMYHLIETLSEPSEIPYEECREFITDIQQLFENDGDIFNVLTSNNLISLNINEDINKREGKIKIRKQIATKKGDVKSNRHLFTSSKFFELNQRQPKYQIFLPEIFVNIDENKVCTNKNKIKHKKSSFSLFENN